jgi:hypothetical protein
VLTGLAAFALAAAALVLVSLGGETQRSAEAAPGDVVDTVALPSKGNDVGIAFDGTRLYYNDGASTNLTSFEPGNPPGTVLNVPVARTDTAAPVDLDAMAYDGTRDVIWAVQHGTENIYTVNKVTGAATFQFSATGRCQTCIGTFKDGLAFDAGGPGPADDSLWWSYDVDHEVFKLDLAGGVLESFKVDGIHASLASCGNSGIAVGGPNLYLGTNGCGTIIRIDKVSKAFVDVFASPTSRPEDLECDPVTYAPTEVMWVRQFEDANNLEAHEIEPGTCGIGVEGAAAGQPLALQPASRDL